MTYFASGADPDTGGQTRGGVVHRPSGTQLAVLVVAACSVLQQRNIRRLTDLGLLHRDQLEAHRSHLRAHDVMLGVQHKPPHLRVVAPSEG